MTELSGLRIDIAVGALEVFRSPRWWIESLRHVPTGRAGVTLPDPKGELFRSIKVGDPVVIDLGIRNEVPVYWRGTVSSRFPGETKDQLELRATDAAQVLVTTRIKQAWENETPEALISWVIRECGLPVGRIGATGMVLPRISASNIPVWQLVQQVKQSCAAAFGLDMSRWALWLGKDGVNWGDFDEPGATVAIASSDNLIDHQPVDWRSGMGMIETELEAGLTHSRLISLQDDRRVIQEVHRALRVRHEGTPEKVRTFVWYGVEHG
jgi:hypothetical protein